MSNDKSISSAKPRPVACSKKTTAISAKTRDELFDIVYNGDEQKVLLEWGVRMQLYLGREIMRCSTTCQAKFFLAEFLSLIDKNEKLNDDKKDTLRAIVEKITNHLNISLDDISTKIEAGVQQL